MILSTTQDNQSLSLVLEEGGQYFQRRMDNIIPSDLSSEQCHSIMETAVNTDEWWIHYYVENRAILWDGYRHKQIKFYKTRNPESSSLCNVVIRVYNGIFIPLYYPLSWWYTYQVLQNILDHPQRKLCNLFNPPSTLK